MSAALLALSREGVFDGCHTTTFADDKLACAHCCKEIMMNEGFRLMFEGLREIVSHGGQLMLAVLAFLLFFIVVAWLDGRDIRRARKAAERPRRKRTPGPRPPDRTPGPTGPSPNGPPPGGNQLSPLP